MCSPAIEPERDRPRTQAGHMVHSHGWASGFLYCRFAATSTFITMAIRAVSLPNFSSIPPVEAPVSWSSTPPTRARRLRLPPCIRNRIPSPIRLRIFASHCATKSSNMFSRPMLPPNRNPKSESKRSIVPSVAPAQEDRMSKSPARAQNSAAINSTHDSIGIHFRGSRHVGRRRLSGRAYRPGGRRGDRAGAGTGAWSRYQVRNRRVPRLGHRYVFRRRCSVRP